MILLLALLACEGSLTTTFPTCTVALQGADPASVLPGEALTLRATPLTERWDTVVVVGGVQAAVESVEREGCDDCDDCRETMDCEPCGEDCDACDNLCATTCAETVVARVPAVAPGQVDVELFNAHGGSNRIAIEVLAAGDTGAPDTGTPDTGAPDTGAPDTGSGDTGEGARVAVARLAPPVCTP